MTMGSGRRLVAYLAAVAFVALLTLLIVGMNMEVRTEAKQHGYNEIWTQLGELQNPKGRRVFQGKMARFEWEIVPSAPGATILLFAPGTDNLLGKITIPYDRDFIEAREKFAAQAAKEQ